MGMVVRTNTMAINAYRQLGLNNSAVAKSLEKLASGYRINRAGDDAAGLAISEKMKAQITGLETASSNAQDGISLIQTAEGNLSEVHDMLNRMVELATKSANGTYTQIERDALQDEVDQLLDEIDRISQSANFNGAKLLDGTMGLNQDAFTKVTNDRQLDDGAINAADFLAKEADGTPKVHLESTAVAASTPSAKIDLGDLQIKADADGNAKVVFSIGGSDYTVNLTGKTADTDVTTDVITGLVTELNKGVNKADGTTTGADSMKIGDAAYTAAAAGKVISLTYQGSKIGNAWKAETAFSGNADEAAALNNGLGFDVVVKSVEKGVQTGGTDVIHKATQVDRAAAEVKATKAGIDINLADLVKDGNTLTIDGKTFIFKVGADSTVAAGANQTLIDVSTAKEGDEVHMAADLLSKQTITGQDNRTWKIGVNDDGTTIHVDQTTASATGKELKTYEDLVSVISAKGEAVEKAVTKVDVTASNIVSGDSIRVGDKAYKFVEEKSTEAPEGVTEVEMGDNGASALANLVSALKTNGVTATQDGSSITIFAKDAKAAAPAVIGGGLTLQIGDTADPYNKMTVAVANMGTNGLGLKGLQITKESLASNAIDTIKNAINTVSSQRAGLGALQNRLEHTINNLDVAAENLSAANSRIRDTDMAKEMMNYTKMNVLVQSAQAMLAQANQQPQSVLQLLQ